ncbi:hypothetical protein Csa_022555 [Cucumis sativus]|uniref:Uncharacterized protein n=1 Tax=Cucumis sativus TaxID=3659 RepID=A0A0A0LSX5_CUCSA|nr:hypothetical protein Csa_022555 [Cucumis sativus]
MNNIYLGFNEQYSFNIVIRIGFITWMNLHFPQQPAGPLFLRIVVRARISTLLLSIFSFFFLLQLLAIHFPHYVGFGKRVVIHHSVYGDERGGFWK